MDGFKNESVHHQLLPGSTYTTDCRRFTLADLYYD